jgi:hypothetical protein
MADIRVACTGSTAIKGSAITQASEAATKTSPTAKTDPLVINATLTSWLRWHWPHRLSQEVKASIDGRLIKRASSLASRAAFGRLFLFATYICHADPRRSKRQASNTGRARNSDLDATGVGLEAASRSVSGATA